MSWDEDNWDELAERSAQRRRRRRPRTKMSQEEAADHAYEQTERDAFVSGLEEGGSEYRWMKEARYRGMFRDI
ncbi:MAG: hypothetical protein ACPHCZ_01250, partial [Candidatus Poseidoniaceae archaeon]